MEIGCRKENNDTSLPVQFPEGSNFSGREILIKQRKECIQDGTLAGMVPVERKCSS